MLVLSRWHVYTSTEAKEQFGFFIGYISRIYKKNNFKIRQSLVKGEVWTRKLPQFAHTPQIITFYVCILSSCFQRLLKLTQPTEEWGPSTEKKKRKKQGSAVAPAPHGPLENGSKIPLDSEDLPPYSSVVAPSSSIGMNYLPANGVDNPNFSSDSTEKDVTKV